LGWTQLVARHLVRFRSVDVPGGNPFRERPDMKPAPRRAPYQIVLAILTQADQGARKRTILRMCNLSTFALDDRLSELIAKGLIEKNGFAYFLTTKGEDAFRQLTAASHMIDGVMGT
jgi:predicted transcriptional regulator